MNNELEILSKLTPEQKQQFAKELGLDKMVAQFAAQAAIKDAKRVYESANSLLTSERAKFSTIQAAETERFNARLATFRKGLDVAESGYAEALAVLHAAESMQ
jgi:hypothetical protein